MLFYAFATCDGIQVAGDLTAIQPADDARLLFGLILQTFRRTAFNNWGTEVVSIQRSGVPDVVMRLLRWLPRDSFHADTPTKFRQIDGAPQTFILAFETGDELAEGLLKFAKGQKPSAA